LSREAESQGSNSLKIDQVVSALDRRQERDEVEREIELLIESGDVERTGERLALTAQGKSQRDSIERETDVRYFRDWPRGNHLARMGEHLTLLVGALS
jgi:hypothetical protein